MITTQNGHDLRDKTKEQEEKSARRMKWVFVDMDNVLVDFQFDDVFHKRMVITHCKNLCKGDFLIDDRGKNGTSEFEGEWIQFGNNEFPDWESVVNYLLNHEQRKTSNNGNESDKVNN